MVPVLLIQKARGFFPFPRSKVQIGHLIALAVQENIRVPVDQCAILVIVEMLPPYWVVLNVCFLLLHSYLHLIFSLVRVSDSLIFNLYQVRFGGNSQIFFNVVFVVFHQSQSSFILDPAPRHVGLLVIVEVVIWVPLLSEIPEGLENLLWSDHFTLLVGLVFLLPLELDGDHASLSGEPRKLFHSVHDVIRSHWNADHPSLACCHPGFGEEHHLLEVYVVGDDVVLQLSQSWAIGVVQLQSVCHGHGWDLAISQGVFARVAEVGAVVH